MGATLAAKSEEKKSKSSAPEESASQSPRLLPSSGAPAGLPRFVQSVGAFSGEMRLTDPGDALERDAVSGNSSSSTGTPSGPAVSAEIKNSIAAAFSEPASPSNGVPIHRGRRAATLARMLDAEAFTVGGRIFLGAKATPDNAALMHHEMAHVAQQSASPSMGGSTGGSIWIGRNPTPPPSLPPPPPAAPAPIEERAAGMLAGAFGAFGGPLASATVMGDDAQLSKSLGNLAGETLADEVDDQGQANVSAYASQAGALQTTIGAESVGIATILQRLHDLVSSPDLPTTDDLSYAPLYLITGFAQDIANYSAEGLTGPLNAAPAPDSSGSGSQNGTPRAATSSATLDQVQGDLENAAAALTDGSRLLDLELEATVHKLIDLRGQFVDATDQDERAAVGFQIGLAARRALLLNQKMQQLRQDLKDGKTPLDLKVETMAAEIASLRSKETTEQGTLGEIGDTPEALTSTTVTLDNPFFQNQIDNPTVVQPDEALPETTDSATSKLQKELADHITAQLADVKTFHDQLIPPAPEYTLPEFAKMHRNWFSLFSQEQEKMDPTYRLVTQVMLGKTYELLGNSALSAPGQVEGGLLRMWALNFVAEQLEGHMGSTNADFAAQMRRFGSKRRQDPVSGYAADPTFNYAEAFPGGTSAGRSAETSSRIALINARQRQTEPLRKPEFEEEDPIHRYLDALKAGAVSPREQPSSIVNRDPKPADGWTYLVDVVDPKSGDLIEREQKVMSPEMANYLLAEQQLQGSLTKHQAFAQSGKPIGGKRMGAAIELASADAAARYLHGETAPKPTPEELSLDAAVKAAEKAEVPKSKTRQDDTSAKFIHRLSGEFDAYFEAFFTTRQSGTWHVAAVLAIASAEYNLGPIIAEMVDPLNIAKLMGQGFAIGFSTAVLDAAGPLGKLMSKGIHAYLGKDTSNVIASAAGVIAFIRGAGDVSSFGQARVWALLSTTVAPDLENLWASVVMAAPTAAGGALGNKAVQAMMERLNQYPPTTARALIDACQPLLDDPTSRAAIIEGTQARITELELAGVRPGTGNEEMDSLVGFEKMLRPYEMLQSVAPPNASEADTFADAPLKGQEDNTEAEKFFEGGRIRTGAERLALMAAVPDELQSSVIIEEAPALAGYSVRVHYDEGMLRMEVGPGAKPEHIRAHVEVVRQLSRYQGVMGTIRRLLSHVGNLLRIGPGIGTKGFEADLEIPKLKAIQADLNSRLAEVEARAKRLNDIPELATDSEERDAIQKEIESIESQLEEHKSNLGSYEPGRGFIAADAPRTSKESLARFLERVWREGAENAYSIYSKRSNNKALPISDAARQSYPKDLAALRESPNVDQFVIQNRVLTGFEKGKKASEALIAQGAFLHFYRSDFDPAQITERIYVDVDPNHATEVMGFVVSNLMTPEVYSTQPVAPGVENMHRIERRGVTGAKVAGPNAVRGRTDSLVIYCRTRADVDWALEKLQVYNAAHPDHFIDEVPAATNPELGFIGVSTGAHPDPSLNSESFGAYLANVTSQVMSEPNRPQDYATFVQRVHERLISQGIDPDHPDRLTRRP